MQLTVSAASSLLLALLCPAMVATAADDSPSAPAAQTSTAVVTSRKLPVESFIDRKVYRLTDELQTTFGTLSNVLTDIPSVNVDIQGPRSGYGADAKFRLDYRPTSHDLLQLRLSHNGHQSSAQGFSRAMSVLNIGYRRQLKENLSALATVADVFNGQRSESTVTNSSFEGSFVRGIRGPSVFVGLNYSFGSRGKKDADLRYEQ